jgi:hypothetical protein
MSSQGKGVVAADIAAQYKKMKDMKNYELFY